MKSCFRYCFLFTLILFIVTSCKKVINLDLGNKTGELVIEATITDQAGRQFVKLSRNVPFTNTNTYPAVTGATVSISDDAGNQYQLTEDTAGTYAINSATGIPGHTYHLSVNTGGNTYTASSVMPQLVNLDSLTFRENIFDTKNNKKMARIHFQDPPNMANQYRVAMYVNRVQVKAVFAFDDQFINGKYADLDLQQNDVDVFPGDTVKVEMQCIDKPVYLYWFTLAQQQANNPGGQVAPANPPTNITPSTLGYFSAHTTQSITKVVN